MDIHAHSLGYAGDLSADAPVSEDPSDTLLSSFIQIGWGFYGAHLHSLTDGIIDIEIQPPPPLAFAL